MKYTIEEMQFAATVREIAKTLRVEAEQKEDRKHSDMDLPARNAAREAWKLANPLSDFIAPALGEVEKVADMLFIRQ